MSHPKNRLASAGILAVAGLASAAGAQVSSVEWSHILLPPNDNDQPIINALPTTGTVVYDNITTWRRGLLPDIPQALGYQAPGNESDIWASDDLHLTQSERRFNEVHFVIRTFNPARPISLAFWHSDSDLNWPDTTPAHVFNFTLPEPIPSEDYSTLVKVTLSQAIDLGEHMWMGLQSIDESGPNEMIAFSAATPAVGWSDDWWSQVPGSQHQNVFFPFPNNFAYGLSYSVIPAPAGGAIFALLALAPSRRRRRPAAG